MPLDNNLPYSICYVLPKMELGGSEKHVIALAAGMKTLGHNVKILTLFRPGFLAPEVERNGISFECLGLPYRWGVKIFRVLYDWMGENSPDIVHTYLFGFDLFAAWPARLRKIPVVISSRREIPEWQKARHRLLVNFGNPFVDKVVCCSGAVRSWTLAHEVLSAQKAVVIYNGVDSKRFRANRETGESIRREFRIPGEACLVGTVANFGVEKGYHYLLKAAALALERNPALWFLLVGDGPLRGKMEKETVLLSRKNQVLFSGFRSDIPELISAMDIFVQTSLVEGMPNSIYEAMACAKPVIATRVGGVPEVLEHEKNAFLVASKDERALADEILRLAADSELRERVGTNARRRIENHYSFEGMLARYEALYRDLLEKKTALKKGKPYAMKTPQKTVSSIN